MLKIASMAAALVLVLAFGADSARAQTPVNFVGGLTFSNISTDGYDTESATGFFVAAGTVFPLSERLAVAPYLAYTQKGTEVGGEDWSYDYIQIPVFLGTSFPMGESASFGIDAGPYFAFQINCDEEGFDCTEFDDHKGTDLGLIGGVSVGIPMGSQTLGFGATYELGMTDLFESLEDEGGYKNRVLYLWASIGTNIGGM